MNRRQWKLVVEKPMGMLEICGEEEVLRSAVQEWEDWMGANHDLDPMDQHRVIRIEGYSNSADRTSMSIVCPVGAISGFCLMEI